MAAGLILSGIPPFIRKYGAQFETLDQQPKLLGILIEWNRQHVKALMAVRISLAFEGLRKQYPELSQLLPKSPLANITVTE